MGKTDKDKPFWVRGNQHPKRQVQHSIECDQGEGCTLGDPRDPKVFQCTYIMPYYAWPWDPKASQKGRQRRYHHSVRAKVRTQSVNATREYNTSGTVETVPDVSQTKQDWLD